jgi:hypothetical protein
MFGSRAALNDQNRAGGILDEQGGGMFHALILTRRKLA